MFWAYVEFMQFLIIWEGGLEERDRMVSAASQRRGCRRLYVAIALGFFVPFLVLLWHPAKRSRAVLAIVCLLMLVGHAAGKWWLVLPMFDTCPPFWLDVAAIVALGALMLLLFSSRAALRADPVA